MGRFDHATGWLTPWPYATSPDELAPFVDPTTGRDTFDGRQVRDPGWYVRQRRHDARVALRHLDELLAGPGADLDTVIGRAASVLAWLRDGGELDDA